MADAYMRLEGTAMVYAGNIIAASALVSRGIAEDREFHLKTIRRSLADLAKAVEAAEAALKAEQRDAA